MLSELLETTAVADDSEALAKRLANSIQREVSAQRDNRTLMRTALRADDLMALSLVVLGALEKSELEPDVRARIALKGAIRFNGLVADSGGAYAVREAADLLGRTPGSIQKSIERNQLLAFKRGGEWMLPVAQFDLEKRETLSGLRELLGALADRDATSRVIFCLSNYEATKMSPLELLRDGFEPSVLCSDATKYLEQDV